MFSIALHQFGALLSLNCRTPFPSIPYTFGTVFAQYLGGRRPVHPCPDASEAPFPCPIQSTPPSIQVSEAFYDEIDAHRITVEREVVAALAHAPGILDFYIWLVWRSWAVNGSAAYLPLFTTSGLCSQSGTTEYSARRFRRRIGQGLRRVKTLQPQCPVDITPDGNRLIVRSSRGCPPLPPWRNANRDTAKTRLRGKQTRRFPTLMAATINRGSAVHLQEWAGAVSVAAAPTLKRSCTPKGDSRGG